MMSVQLHRREWLGGVAATGLAMAFGRRGSAAGPKATIEKIEVITRQPKLYHGWATLARRNSGELLVSYSGRREGHVCPFGRVELIRSGDGGRTWSDPQVVWDSPIDDRDSGVIETAKGTILVTTFTSLAFEKYIVNAENLKPGQKGAWDPERLKRWLEARDRLSPEERKKRLGVWMQRSTDGGKTWSTPLDSLVNSPHGPIQLADGRLLYAGKDLWREGDRVGVCESSDDGLTWRWLAEISERPGDQHKNYHELHAVEARSGRLVLQIRNHNRENAGETLQCESTDGGKTWSAPRSIGVWGLPSHLLRLGDGRLLMTYGYRRKPFGNQARLSEDEGRSWSEPISISTDGASGDLGYPSTVQLADGSLVTVWYELPAGSTCAVLRQARWRLG